MKQKQLRLILAVVLAAVAPSPCAHAVTYLTEQFTYSGTGQLGTNATLGATGSVPGWNSPQSQITFTNGSHSLDGTSLGLVASAGDKISINGTNIIAGPFGCYNKFANQSNFPTTITTNIYYSFLYRFNVGTDIPATGVPIAQVNRQNSGFGTGVAWQLIAQQSGGNIQLGICKALGPSTNYAATNLAAGQIFFVVIRQQIIAGATNDIDDLWINPAPGTFGTNEANVPPTSATTTNGVEDTSNSGPGRFWVAGSGANANMDELRIASTWAEVTPPVGQCISAGIAADPTNVTQCAEIGASFSVGAIGTSPAYQWQVSSNGTAPFTNIAGATLPNYSTPNLQLATDNSNAYRAIISVPCDNSTATSTVATVTLTAPVPTTPGVVMDDFFTDKLRDNTPVTPTNSVWRTSGNSSGLDAITGKLIGTPVSAASSLWIGNFVDESVTNLPVHLTVGNSITVTLPFTPKSYGSFTNNASLRFGLFDYADGQQGMVTNDTFTGAGSGGNGVGVRGYMLSLNFGPTFTENSPLSLLVRNGLNDINLMGSTGDYASMNSGPNGGGFDGQPAFLAGTNYTLVFTINRTDINSIDFTTTISGGGNIWTFTSTDTNYAYHRFDAFAIRPNSLETSADAFTFPEFKVEVVATGIAPFNITSIKFQPPNSVALTWQSINGITYQVLSTPTLNPSSWTTNATVVATGSSTSYTNTPISGARFFRVVSP
jgi:hypothetical protein